MKNILSNIILLLFIFQIMEIGIVKAVGEDPLYEIDLDLPYIERWRQIIQDKGAILKSFAYKYKEHVNIPQEEADKFVSYGDAYPEIKHNLEAISILSGVDLPTLYTYNFMYDLESMGCTSVIIRQPDNTLFHARNLDYSFQEEISQIAIRVNWKKGGKIIYKSETLVGFVSLITVTKPGQFSVSINYRRLIDSRDISIDALVNKHYPQGIYLPQIAVDQANSFEEAVEILKTVNVSSPIYFIVSGLEGNQGVIIERNRESYKNIYSLDDQTWFLAQTNVDIDDKQFNDFRLNQTIRNIKSLGQENCTKENILNQVMSVFPANNSLTISTSVYSAYDGDFISRNYLINNNNNNKNESIINDSKDINIISI